MKLNPTHIRAPFFIMRSLLGACLISAAPVAKAEVSTNFANVGPVDSGTFRTAANPVGNDTIILDYYINSTGEVSLDASTTNTNATFINLVNQFDRPNGTAGTITNSDAFNASFSLKIVPVRAGTTTPRLSVTTLDGGGLGVEGQNSNRVDGRTLVPPATQMLHFELTSPAGISLRFKDWSWVAGSGADMRFSVGENSQDFVNVAASGTANFNLVSNPLTLGNGGTLSFAETPDSSNGAGLGGFTFDVLGKASTDNDVVVSFSNSGDGFGPTPPFVSTGNSTATITLGFSINQIGIISLDASTTLPNTVFGNMVEEWDHANVGSVANPDLFGKSFTLTGIPSSGNLSISELGGGGIGIQGENSNRVDGLNYGPENANSTPETLFWVLSAPPGLALEFKNWSYIEGEGGDMRVSNGGTIIDFPNMLGAKGALTLDGFQLSYGDSLAFSEIPGIGATTGAGIAGFNFSVISLHAPPATGGILLCERWNDTTFYSTSELLSDNRFYSNADICRHDNPISSSTMYQGRYYSTRSRGWITAPETGVYRFWVSGGNAVQLLLSEDNTKYSKRVIAEIDPEIGTGHGIRSDSINLWDNYASQMSQEIYLTAGQTYYLETIQTIGHTIKGHASIAWARPGKARTPLDPAFVEPYALTTDDADDDYLPDTWENQYNLDPLDNGFINPAGQGERGDFDGDGLSNREEYLLGTDPSNSDTDGDGESDGNEVNALGSNALVANAITDSFLSQVALGAYVSSSVSWTMTTGGLLSDHFRGEATWDFSVPSDGNWLFRLDLELMGATYGNEEVPIVIKVDGKTVVRQQVRFGSGKLGLLQALSPWLVAGNHQITVLVDNSLARRTVRLVSLKIFAPSNPDALLAKDNRVLRHPSSTRTSPAFIEGYARDPGSVTLNGMTAQIGTGNGHWFANVPLSNVSAPQPYVLQYEQGWQSTGTFTWQATNVMDAETLTIRQGDALRVGAWGSDPTMPSTVTHSSGETFALIGQQTTTMTFSTAGVFTITGKLQSGASASLTLKVIAPPSFSHETVDALDNCLRTLLVSASPEVEFDTQEDLSRLILSRTSTTASVGILPAKPVQLGVAARLFTGGPVLAIQQVNVISVADALQNDLTSLSVSSVPGYKIIQGPLTVLNLPAGARVDVSIFRAGVMFTNGTTLKSFRSEDLNNGSTVLEFLFPLGQPGGFCHKLLIYDRDGLYLGTR